LHQLPESRRLLLENRMRLAVAQLNFTIAAFDHNFARIAAAVARATTAQADLVVFTELATTGYPPRDLLNHARFIDFNLALLDRVAALSTDRLGILIGFVDRNPTAEGKALYNAAALCHRGRIVGVRLYGRRRCRRARSHFEGIHRTSGGAPR
jgi:NAD+ synthase (glutamine-hydrolysing)